MRGVVLCYGKSLIKQTEVSHANLKTSSIGFTHDRSIFDENVIARLELPVQPFRVS